MQGIYRQTKWGFFFIYFLFMLLLSKKMLSQSPDPHQCTRQAHGPSYLHGQAHGHAHDNPEANRSNFHRDVGIR